jgi:hypothetical protein
VGKSVAGGCRFGRNYAERRNLLAIIFFTPFNDIVGTELAVFKNLPMRQ